MDAAHARGLGLRIEDALDTFSGACFAAGQAEEAHKRQAKEAEVMGSIFVDHMQKPKETMCF